MIKFYLTAKHWSAYYELAVVSFEDACESIYLVLKIELFWFVILLFVLETCLFCCIASTFLSKMQKHSTCWNIGYTYIIHVYKSEKTVTKTWDLHYSSDNYWYTCILNFLAYTNALSLFVFILIIEVKNISFVLKAILSSAWYIFCL